MDYGLKYNGDSSVLEGYTDASWITDQEDYASTSGWIFTLGGGAVSWGSKKQSFFNKLYYGSRVCGTGFMLQRSRMATKLLPSQGYGNNLDKVHLSECESEAASYEFKGLALKHSEKPR
ncbi:hypothetical protein Tco_1241593 [Tanacetum coccineum]